MNSFDPNITEKITRQISSGQCRLPSQNESSFTPGSRSIEKESSKKKKRNKKHITKHVAEKAGKTIETILKENRLAQSLQVDQGRILEGKKEVEDAISANGLKCHRTLSRSYINGSRKSHPKNIPTVESTKEKDTEQKYQSWCNCTRRKALNRA